MPRRPNNRATIPNFAQLVRQLMAQGQSRREAVAHAKKIIGTIDRFVGDERGRMTPEEPGPSIFDVLQRKTRTKKGGAR